MHSLIPGWRMAKPKSHLSPEASPVTSPPGVRVRGGVPAQQLCELLLVPADAEHHGRHRQQRLHPVAAVGLLGGLLGSPVPVCHSRHRIHWKGESLRGRPSPSLPPAAESCPLTASPCLSSPNAIRVGLKALLEEAWASRLSYLLGESMPLILTE